MKTLMKRLFGGSGSKPATRRFRPDLESLEEHIVPATFQWEPQGGSDDWNAAANWLEGGMPTANVPANGDTIVVPSGKSGLNLTGGPTNVRMEVSSGFAQSIVTPGSFTINGGWVRNGLISMMGDVALTNNVNLGSSVSSANFARDAGAGGSSNLVVSGGNWAGFNGVNVGSGVNVSVASTAMASIGLMTFADGAAGKFTNSGTTYFAGQFTSDTDGGNYSNVLHNAAAGILYVNLYSIGTTTVNSYIHNEGYMLVNGGTLSVTGRSPNNLIVTGQPSVINAGTAELMAGVTVNTDDDFYCHNGTLKISSTFVSGQTTVTLSEDLTLAGTSVLVFDADETIAGADLTLDVDNSFRVGSNATVKINIDFTAGTSDQIKCSYADFPDGTLLDPNNSKLLVRTYGTLPQTCSYKVIDTSTGREFSFFSLRTWDNNVTGLVPSWNGNDFFLER